MLCLRRMFDMSSSLLSAFPNSEYSYSFLRMRNRKKISCIFVTSSIGLAIPSVKYSSEDRTDETSGLFQRISCCSTEEENARNSVLWNKNRSKLSELRLNHSTEEKKIRNSVP
jgi:hypothetical protein